MTTCSYFLGICFSTSCFNRRSRNGRSTCLHTTAQPICVPQWTSL